MRLTHAWLKSVSLLAALLVAIPAQGGTSPPKNPPEQKPATQTGAKPAGKPAEEPAEQAPAAAPVALAVIVNPKNPTTGLTFTELRSHLKLELQFWSNGERATLLLRASDSEETKILLAHVYEMAARELRKYWIGRVFRGEIAAAPTIVPTAAAAGARVRDSEGAFSIVLATEVPDGVRVLAIDGKRPGEVGYPLTAPEAKPAEKGGT